MVDYWHNESGYPSQLLFTGNFSDTGEGEEVVIERFYYKDGVKPAAVTTMEDFDKVYNGEISHMRVFKYLADISGWGGPVEFLVSADTIPWFGSGPSSIMKTFHDHHNNITTDHFDEDIYE
jgi:hypothetical protein